VTSGGLATILIAEDPGSESPNALAIIADRRLTAAALAALLMKDPKYRLIRGVHGIEDVRQALAVHRPTVLIVDSTAATFFSAIDPSGWNGRTLLLLDPEDDAAVFLDAVRAGARGYLSRSASREALQAAVETLRETGFYLDPLLVERILPAVRRSRETRSGELSPREREILVRIATGLSTKQVAREYAITAKTVGNHINSIYQKLNLRHRGQLVLYAAQHGLTGIEARSVTSVTR
jgi:DNA-binding NarL/FixJ family response regulator